MDNAVRAVRTREMNVTQASKNFAVPRSTLSDILKGKVPENSRKMGLSSVLMF